MNPIALALLVTIAVDPAIDCPPHALCAERAQQWYAYANHIRKGRETLGGFTVDRWLPAEEQARQVADFWYNVSLATDHWFALEDRLEYARQARDYTGPTLWYSHAWWPQ